VERLYASVEILALERRQGEGDPTYRQLVTYTAVHYNYAWLTVERGSLGEGSERGLGIGGPIPAAESPPLFLAPELGVAASQRVQQALVIPDRVDLRLVGVLNGGPREPLALVYVARLRQAGAQRRDPPLGEMRICGNGDLLAERAHFDPWSRLL